MSKFFKFFIDNILVEIVLPSILCFYEKRIMYRIRRAWGIANLKNVGKKGNNINIVGYSRFLNGENISIGSNVSIGYGCFFFGRGGIDIGDHTILSRNITIYSSNHNYRSNYIPYNNEYIDKKVVIGKGVWVGMGVSITPGVTIGDGAIIGMGTVVSRDIEPGAVVVGSGQKTIFKRDMEKFYTDLKEERIFCKTWPGH